jgi:hypothetical protein
VGDALVRVVKPPPPHTEKARRVSTTDSTPDTVPNELCADALHLSKFFDQEKQMRAGNAAENAAQPSQEKDATLDQDKFHDQIPNSHSASDRLLISSSESFRHL